MNAIKKVGVILHACFEDAEVGLRKEDGRKVFM